ncbi:formate dehydrogenase accessory sulfurtransferase FdhD [Aestuariibacter salexigens]|uniref:formate dehydrogenase accessory sulfurtransferase FdhD n=1 Tax=Aestuariibacter salexigens TaxID=226010 RepID=UPI0004232523|nr:formate dehydrogenase accessory sulfurtransferase FdhD [Aestuariibacter salexigens]
MMNRQFPTVENELVEEVPLAISVNGIALSVMMISPFDIEDFLFGFFITEGLVKHTLELQDLNITKTSLGFAADIQLTGRREQQLIRKRRLFATPAGCGLCHNAALEQAFLALTPFPSPHSVTDIPFATLRDRMKDHQLLGKKSGALHAAMFVQRNNNTIICREDIGRHNALDKVIGAALRNKLNLADGYLVITSRCGADLVQKAVIADIDTLVSFSSPSQLAVSLAKQACANLVYLPRNNQPVIFTQAKDTQHA